MAVLVALAVAVMLGFGGRPEGEEAGSVLGGALALTAVDMTAVGAAVALAMHGEVAGEESSCASFGQRSNAGGAARESWLLVLVVAAAELEAPVDVAPALEVLISPVSVP